MRFVVVGNGIAGLTAAQTIRRINGDASVTVVCDETEPAYSACVLPHYVGGEIGREKVLIRSFSDYSRLGIRLLSQQKVIGMDAEDKRVILRDQSLGYDRLVIATGSRAVIPPSVQGGKNGIFTFKSLNDADSIVRWKGSSAVVVGSGPIGIEAGIALKRRGYQVVVVELLHHILPRIFDDHPACLLKRILEQKDIEVLEQERVLEILGTDRVSGVATDKRTIECDTVIIATGMKPRRGWVSGRVKAGEYGGISVNERMETSLPHVYACGDCVDAKDLITGRVTSSMLWHNARRQGEVAGCNAAGVALEYSGSLNATGLNLFGTQAVSIGMGADEETERFEVIEREKEDAYQRVILHRSEVVGVQAINWPEDIGYLLTSLVRKDKIGRITDAISRRRPPLRATRHFSRGYR